LARAACSSIIMILIKLSQSIIASLCDWIFYLTQPP
jgi:hypothetical protein